MLNRAKPCLNLSNRKTHSKHLEGPLQVLERSVGALLFLTDLEKMFQKRLSKTWSHAWRGSPHAWRAFAASVMAVPDLFAARTVTWWSPAACSRGRVRSARQTNPAAPTHSTFWSASAHAWSKTWSARSAPTYLEGSLQAAWRAPSKRRERSLQPLGGGSLQVLEGSLQPLGGVPPMLERRSKLEQNLKRRSKILGALQVVGGTPPGNLEGSGITG